MDWKITAILATIFLGVYNFLVKKFFRDNEDWRIIVPVIFVGTLALAAYTAFTYRDIKTTSTSLSNIAAISIVGGAMLVLTLLSFADQSSHASVIAPIMALSIVITVLLGSMFLNEPLTTSKIAGVVLALVSVLLLVKD